jgi:hypothetical protein
MGFKIGSTVLRFSGENLGTLETLDMKMHSFEVIPMFVSLFSQVRYHVRVTCFSRAIEEKPGPWQAR